MLTYVRISVDRDRRDMQLAPERAFIQRLNIFQSMFETVTTEIDFVLRDRIEHEGVIRIG